MLNTFFYILKQISEWQKNIFEEKLEENQQYLPKYVSVSKNLLIRTSSLCHYFRTNT